MKMVFFNCHLCSKVFKVEIVLSLILVMAGDVEPNPGPSRKCQNCQLEYMLICQKICENCGLLVKSVKCNQKTLSQNTQYYHEIVVKILVKKVESYKSNSEKQQALSKSTYRANPDKFKAISLKTYRANPDKLKALSQQNYRAIPTNSRLFLKKTYRANQDKFKAISKKNLKS